MKRMDVFIELPVSVVDDWIVESIGNRITEFDNCWQAKAVAHAINHVDALADALEVLLDAILSKKAEDSINNQIIAAAQALSKYRGDK
jgi:hypothetical protein